jgi:asparagine N-glycosylation enzyme membrane subunit Stt3
MVVKRENLRELMLALALFFNPLGFDIIFNFIMSITCSYWLADAIMYAIAGIFFIIYLIMRRKRGIDSITPA